MPPQSKPDKSAKLDLFKLHQAEYATPRQPIILKVKKARYLAVTGRGAPGGKEFQAKIGALYGMAFTVKMTRKFAGLGDYAVCKLEGQYWLEDDGAAFLDAPPASWCWRLLIRTPDFIKPQELRTAAATLLEKGKSPEVAEVDLYSLTEGSCVQMLHVGPYDREAESIAEMHRLMEADRWQPHGLHHEIYLSDARRVAPAKLRTILRLPVRKKR